METRSLKANGVLFRIHFILIHKAIIEVYTEEQIKELAKILSDVVQIDNPDVTESYRKEISKAVKANYTADDLEKVVLELLVLTDEKRAYKGIGDADLGLLDSLLDIFTDLASKWMESKDSDIIDCGLKTSAMIRSIRNIFNDDKFGHTLELLNDMRILGKIYE